MIESNNMGSKRSKRERQVPRHPVENVENRAKPFPWLLIVASVVIATGGGLFLFGTTSQQAPADTRPTDDIAATNAVGNNASVASASTFENLDDLPLPPLPYMNQTAGPPDLMRQAYIFAARHPEILDYVPCYCGCGQTDGHVGNTDCFVASRAPNGQVMEWATHGMT